jgi:hypothetical protein
MSRLALAAIAVLLLSGCTVTPDPTVAPGAGRAFDFPIECGPIHELALCHQAVEVASTAKLNPPPIAAATVRRPRADDACITAFHPCGLGAVIVVIQSGDTLQEIALVPGADGWIRLDLIR